jgi:hypothetical protein
MSLFSSGAFDTISPYFFCAPQNRKNRKKSLGESLPALRLLLDLNLPLFREPRLQTAAGAKWSRCCSGPMTHPHPAVATTTLLFQGVSEAVNLNRLTGAVGRPAVKAWDF